MATRARAVGGIIPNRRSSEPVTLAEAEPDLIPDSGREDRLTIDPMSGPS